MILLTLSLLAIAIWRLAVQPVVASATGAVLPAAKSQWLSSLLFGQGLANLGLVLSAVFVGLLVPRDGGGGFWRVGYSGL